MEETAAKTKTTPAKARNLLVKRIKGELGESAKVLATGGLTPLFAKGTPVIEHVDPDLTIRGLLEVHRRNTRA